MGGVRGVGREPVADGSYAGPLRGAEATQASPDPRASPDARATSDPESAARLGGRIRALRKARGLTLTRVAAATGLSHPFLSQVERGIHQPSLGSLRRIAVALETSPVELVAAVDPLPGATRRVELQRAGQGAVPEGFSSGNARLLAHAARGFHPIEVEVTRREPDSLFVHAEGELVYVVAGAVRIELDGGAHLLEEGDSAFFAGGVPHRWWTDDAPARLLVVKETVRPGHGMGSSPQDR